MLLKPVALASLLSKPPSVFYVFQKATYYDKVPDDEGYNPGNFFHTMKRLKRTVKDDFRLLGAYVRNRGKYKLRKPIFPTEADYLIIGGGAIGSSIAYFLKERARSGLSVTVIEKDLTVNSDNLNSMTYEQASTTLSVGGIRQQFSVKQNIQLSVFGAEFLRNIDKYLGYEGSDLPDISFRPYGYLTLATADGAQTLKDNHILQLELGAKNELLSPYQLNKRFPWLNTKGIELACLGLSNEGWFDPWAFLMALRAKSIVLGANLIEGEAIEFIFHNQKEALVEGFPLGDYIGTNEVVVRLKTGEKKKITFSKLIIAAGASTGHIMSEMLHVKKGKEGYRGMTIPIERRKRYVFGFEAPGGPGCCSPMIVDPSGIYVRRDGLSNMFICGRSPPPEQEPDVKNLTVDRDYFDNYIWHLLADRIPDFERLKMKSSWAGYYDYNTFDQNAIFGYHPSYTNVFIASGFSGHGIQHAPGIGRAAMEYLIEGRYYSGIDMRPFYYDRIVEGRPLYETAII